MPESIYVQGTLSKLSRLYLVTYMYLTTVNENRGPEFEQKQKCYIGGFRAVVLNLPNFMTIYSSSRYGDSPTIKLFPLLLHFCNFSIVINYNASI